MKWIAPKSNQVREFFWKVMMGMWKKGKVILRNHIFNHIKLTKSFQVTKIIKNISIENPII